MIEVVFEEHELRFGVMVGCERQIDNLLHDRKQRHRCPEDRCFEVHIQSSLAEQAVAKVGGRYWSGSVGNRAASDVGDWEVKYTEKPDGGLLLNTDCVDEKKYVLVTGRAPRFVLRGWLFGWQAKDQKYWREDIRSPAYIVPQSDLNPMPEWMVEQWAKRTGAG